MCRPGSSICAQLVMTWAALKTVLEAKTLMGHNAKFDALWLKIKCKLKLDSVPYCTCTASSAYCRNRRREIWSRARLSAYLNVDLAKGPGLFRRSSMLNLMSRHRTAQMTSAIFMYCKSTVDARLREARLEAVAELEMALLPVIVDIEAAGFAVDRSRLGRIHDGKLKAKPVHHAR